MLTLVLVKSLDLNVEYRIGIKVDSVGLLDECGKLFLVAELDLLKVFEHLSVVGICLELFKLASVINKAVADKLGQKLCQLRI